jgi:hypothetical protein
MTFADKLKRYDRFVFGLIVGRQKRVEASTLKARVLETEARQESRARRGYSPLRSCGWNVMCSKLLNRQRRR